MMAITDLQKSEIFSSSTIKQHKEYHMYLLYFSLCSILNQKRETCRDFTEFHFTSQEGDDKHSVMIVQTILKVTICYNKIRNHKAGGLYRKHTYEVTDKIILVATAKNVGDN